MFYTTMEKKKYITPAVLTIQLNVHEGILLRGSDGTDQILRNGGDTTGNIVSDTKDEGDYDLWDE